MRLFLVHCGYYDPEIVNGLYEFHVNLFVVAESFEAARAKAKADPMVITKKMHIDGIQMIEAVQGHRLTLSEDRDLAGATVTHFKNHRELAPKPVSAN